MLQFDKIYKYFNGYLQSLKNELLADELIKDTPIPIEEIKIKYNGGDILESDYELEDRTFTIINPDISVNECKVFIGNIRINDFTINGNNITIADGKPLTKFDIKMYDNVGHYLEGVRENDTFEGFNYITRGVVGNLGIQLLDTRVLTYMQTVGVDFTSLAEYRNNMMLLCERFAKEIHNTTLEIDEYSLNIRCTQMPQYTQNYKGHGVEEFNTAILFDIKISVAPDYVKDEGLYIDGILIPYLTMETTKTTELEADLGKYTHAKYTIARNLGAIRITGTSYSNNDVLQKLKKEVRNLNELETIHNVIIQKGIELESSVSGRTITVNTNDDFIVYNNGTEMILNVDYSVSYDSGVHITVLDENINMDDIVVLSGLNAFKHAYSMVVTEGIISSIYGGNIEYSITFQPAREDG